MQEAFKVKVAEARRKEADSKRKERLAFVTMSLSNMMPDKPRKARGDRDKAAKFNRAAAGGSEESEDESEYSGSDESEEDAPIRRRAARNVTYNMKEYDDMMKSAIDDGKVKYSAEEMQVRLATSEPFRAGLFSAKFHK